MPNKNINILQLNVNGLSPHSSSALSTYLWKQNIDIACLCETEIDSFPLGSFSWYKHIIRPNCENPQQRGVAVLATEPFELNRYSSLEPPIADMVVCLMQTHSRRFTLCSIYSPPNNPDKLAEICNAISKVQQAQLNMNSEGLIIIGDFNARHHAWGDHSINKAGETILRFVYDNNFHLVNQHNEPTCLCENESSNIDLFLISHNLQGLIGNQ